MYGRKDRNMCPVHAVYSRDDSSAFAIKAKSEPVDCETKTSISLLVSMIYYVDDNKVCGIWFLSLTSCFLYRTLIALFHLN